MPDQNNGAATTEGGDKQLNNEGKDGKVTDTTKTENAGTPNFDSSKISDEDFEKVFEDQRLFNHPRFKALAEAKKERDALKKQQDDAENTRLAEEKKFSDLAAKHETEAKTWKERYENSTKANKVLAEAAKIGAANPEVVLKLVDLNTVVLNDDGSVTGADAAVKALIEANPYLKGDKTQKRIGADGNPSESDTSQLKRFKHSEIIKMSPEEYAKNEKDIMAAMKANLVEDDVAH